MGYIYRLDDPRNGEVRYIGQTVQRVSKRYDGHLRDKTSCHKTNWIKSLTLVGLRPALAIQEICDDSQLDDREIFWIAHYTGLGAALVNSDTGGRANHRLSQETRAKISAAQKGKSETKESLEKRRLNQKHWKLGPDVLVKRSLRMKGHAVSPETRRKIGDAHRAVKDRPLSAETRAKLSLALRGKPKPDCFRKSVSRALKGRKPSEATIAASIMAHRGVPASAETRAKLSMVRRGRPWTVARREAQNRIRIQRNLPDFA